MLSACKSCVRIDFNQSCEGVLMRQRRSINLLEGHILPKLIRLAMPIMASSFIGLAYTMTDMFWVARLGERAVAAVGTGGTLLWLVDSLFSIPRVGGQVLVGQSIGAGEPDEARIWARASLRLGYVMASVIMLVFFSMPGVLTAVFRFNEAETIVRTESYIRIVAVGMIPKVGVRLYSAVFTASGNSFTPFIIYVTGLAINMVLDPMLIVFLRWEVAGAAVATVIAETIAYAMMLFFVRRHPLFSKLRILSERIRLSLLKPVFRLGAPIAVQGSVHAVVTILISRQIVRFGDLAVAAQRLGAQVESISWMTVDGFSAAVNAFMAQNFGARSHGRVTRGYWAGFWLVSAACTVTSLILYFLGRPITAVFFSDPVAVEHGRHYLQVLSASQLMQGLILLSSSAFAALGQSFIPAVIVTTLMIARLPLGSFLSGTALGVNGIWWSLTLTTNAAGLLLITIFPFYMRRLRNVTG